MIQQKIALLSTLLLFCYAALSQNVTNVMAVQDGNRIVVSYDIDKDSPEVQLTVSTDGGKTFSAPLKKVSGDVGDVRPGHRRIVWDVLAEMESFKGDNIVFNVTAKSENNHNGHEWVDLGLSVKWATCNVGASKPEEYGDYFAWGETQPKKEYIWANLKYCTRGNSYDNVKFSKYVANSAYGTVDNKTVFDLEDDAAHVNWGGGWRMPTDAEWTELRENCTCTWTIRNGVKGYKVTSKKSAYTSKSIFLPAAGFHNYDRLNGAGHFGCYWSSSLNADYSNCAFSVDFNMSHVYRFGGGYRFNGLTVRPVSE